MTDTRNAESSRIGRTYEDHVESVLPERGLTITAKRVRHECHVEWDFQAVDKHGNQVLIECKASDGTGKQGADRSDNLRKFLGDLKLLDQWCAKHPDAPRPRVVLVTTSLPPHPRKATKIPWRTILDEMVFDNEIVVIEIPYPKNQLAA